MLGFVGRDVRDSGEYVGTVCSASLDAVAVIDATFSCLVVNIEVGEVVVEIDRSGTKVTSEKGGVSREDGRYVDVAFSAQGNGQTCLPFVEVGDDGLRSLASRELAGSAHEVSWRCFTK